MSVPLDRLYNFLDDLCDRNDIIIYRFFPHGSRKITDLVKLKDYTNLLNSDQQKFAIFNDQEPLNFELYNNAAIIDELLNHSEDYAETRKIMTEELYAKYKRVIERMLATFNLKLAVNYYMSNIPVILVHSEKRSSNLKKYQSINFITVYWWSHALIARDWFRYAVIDPNLNHNQIDKTFLIYNRDWSGTREYRLKFSEMIVNNNLHEDCSMGFNPSPIAGYHYTHHKFINPALQINRFDLGNYFHLNTVPSTASADYNSSDYCSTAIEVVLETLFDDDRLHLTEKILRPIACGQPFILAATHGSLEYLRSYGFETYGNFINETYDTITDPLERLDAIVCEMKRIANLSVQEKSVLYSNLRAVAKRNKELFFSDHWQQNIINEYKQNFLAACNQLDNQTAVQFRSFIGS